MDALQVELKKMEELLNQEALSETPTPGDAPSPVAEKILCAMIIGPTNGIKAVIACMGTGNMTKEELYFTIWEVIGACERRGLRVIAAVCDGAGVNRGFFQIHTPLYPTDSKVVFVVKNKFADRPLYFVNDVAHLQKTSRNGVYKSRQKVNA